MEHLDSDGYPTEAFLKLVKEWPHEAGYKALLEGAQEVWRYPRYFVLIGKTWSISTGGWSGNEDIIGALQGNHMFWMLCWQSSKRGGHYTFTVPNVGD